MSEILTEFMEWYRDNDGFSMRDSEAISVFINYKNETK